MNAREGRCHCGAVRWVADLPDEIVGHRCNCSICAPTGFIHVIVPEREFRLVAGADKLTTYSFGSGVAKHHFCSVCGVKSFYVPRSNPDGFSLNLNCLDQSTFTKVTIEDFDGQNWEENAASLRHLSE